MVTDSTNGTGKTPVASSDADAASSDAVAGQPTQVAQANSQPVIVARQVAQAGDQAPLLAMLPQAGEWVIIKVEPGSAVQLPVDLAQFTGHEVNGNLELTLPNGGVVVLEGFVAAASSGTPPELLTAEGKPIDLAEFLVAVGVAPEALHVAQHETPPPPVDHGGHFSDGPGPQILGGLTPIGAIEATDLLFPTQAQIQEQVAAPIEHEQPEAPRALEFSVTGATVTEGQVAVFTVSYTGDTLAPGQTATIHVATGPGFTGSFTDATPGADYNPVGIDLTFTGGQPTALTVGVTTIDDTIVEGPEDFTLVLSAPSQGTIIHSPGDGVIVDNNDASNLHWSIVAASTVTEGNAATYTVGYAGATLATGMAETQDVYLDDQRKITEQARVSWNSVATSHENVIELQKTVVANTQTRDAYIKQFDIGQRGLLDLLNEDNELYLSKDNLVTATFAETFARFRLLAVAGGLEKALSVSPPEQAAVPVEQ